MVGPFSPQASEAMGFCTRLGNTPSTPLAQYWFLLLREPQKGEGVQPAILTA
jgi:hypothetical protein